jgi:hypothetical protein
MLLAYYKRVISKGYWRNEMLTRVRPRAYDKILEVPAASADKYEPLLLDHPNVS